MILSPAFQNLCTCHEEQHRLAESLRSPFQLFRGFFLRLDVMRRWRKVVSAAPWLQDLLEVCCSVAVPSPQGMCLSCRERQAVRSEVSACKRHPPRSGQPADRGSAGCRHAAGGYDCLCDLERPGKKEIKTIERPEPGDPPGPWASVQQLKHSLKKHLETHQLHLEAIEVRLSSLERRAQDVTRHLEKAKLELEAIKQGSVTLKTLVEEGPILSPERRNQPPEPYRSDPGRRRIVDCPAGGSNAHHREDLQTGLSACQRHVDVLIKQITQQINQMESDISVTSQLRQSAV
ncbi:kinetochore protein NDC80 homolog isoform X2 [Dendropsophus ebraccatus]